MREQEPSAAEVAEKQGTRVWNQWDDATAAKDRAMAQEPGAKEGEAQGDVPNEAEPVKPRTERKGPKTT